MMDGAQTQLDSRAIELASQAMARMEQHEKACDERMAYIREGQGRLEVAIKSGFSEVHSRIDGVQDRVSGHKDSQSNRMLLIAGAIIMSLLTIAGALAIQAFGWGK